MLNVKLILTSFALFFFHFHSAKAMLPLVEENNSFKKNIGKNIILLYEDEGASLECVENIKYSLKVVLNAPYEIKGIKAEDVEAGIDKNSTALLIMPGGRATPYRQKLYEKNGGIGNKTIKNFVEEGGNYLGLGAGAYYAGSEVLFNQESLNEKDRIKVSGEKLLSFFPGKIVGPMFHPFVYNSQEGSKAVKLTFEKNSSENLSQEKLNEIFVYYNGGGFFEDLSDPTTQVIARYITPEKRPAIIETQVGKGKVVLSHVHPEYTLATLDRTSPEDVFIQTNLRPFLIDEYSLHVFKVLLKKLALNIKN